MMKINPQLLTNKSVVIRSISKEEDGLEGCAVYTRRQGDRGEYEVTLVAPILIDRLQNSRMHGVVSYSDLEVGLILQQIAHIEFGSLDVDHVLSDDIYFYIWNTIMDMKDQYFMAYRYPMYDIYTQIALLTLKYQSPARPDTMLHVDLMTVYYLARYGVIRRNADRAFMQFALPLLLSAREGDSDNAKAAAMAIYLYLKRKHNGKLSTKEQREAWEKASSANNGMAILISIDGSESGDIQGISLTDVDLKLVNDIVHGMIPGIGKAAGSTGDVLELDDAGSFYRETCSLYPHVIQMVRREMLQICEQYSLVRAYEGDLSENDQDQQDLFLASQLGDEFPAYTYFVQVLLSISMVTARDVSWSTTPVMVEYARAIVILHEALANIEGSFTASIDFNVGARLVKGFRDALRKSEIVPQAHGGTQFSDALALIKKLSWEQDTRMLFLITDGDIGDIEKVVPELQKLEREKNVCVWLVDLYQGDVYHGSIQKRWYRAFPSTVENLAASIAQHVVAQVKRSLNGI